MKDEIKYEAPLVEIIEVAVEKGFATSGISGQGTDTSGDYEFGERF